MHNLQPEFDAVTDIHKAIGNLNTNQAIRVLSFVQNYLHECNRPTAPIMNLEAATVTVETKKPEEKKTTKKKATTKKAPAKTKKEPVVVPTLEEMMSLCRDTATRLKSADKVKALIKAACNVEAIKDANPDTFVELTKKLNDAK